LPLEDMLERERVANRRKHWVRAVTACNSRCLFCLDSDTPRNVYIPESQVKAEIDRGRMQFDADKIIISGGEASLHPQFQEFIRYAKSAGYERVQTVTNGYRFAEREFFESCMEAGLGEITFSLHGHTPELHDHLTQTAGAFKRLMKGMIRALRDGRPIVNVDVVINKQNVGVIDKIVELCAGVGITEFDLLHVIPQAAAFENRDELFYDPREHLDKLQKVFRLNRHPGFVIWTNRFPIGYLEGLEDLIQDPHKMLDEVNGRRFQVRRYLDEGTALDCRQKERCVHCFIEPFCTTTDRVVAQQNAKRWDVWWIGEDDAGEVDELPYGSRFIGRRVRTEADLESSRWPVYAEVSEPNGIGTVRGVVVADSAAHLDAWVHELTDDIEIEIRLNRETAEWMLQHREQLRRVLDRIRIHQPSHEHLETATANDVRDPAAFFTQLALPVRVSGLPACMAPDTVLQDEIQILPKALFEPDSGRLSIRELARLHVRERYRSKSLRCADCRVNSRCDGIAINMIRDQGLALARPLTTGAWADEAERQLVERWPVPPQHVADGRPLEPVAESLPGFPGPVPAPLDPVVIIAQEQMERMEARRRTFAETRNA
jgi:MoaA/NifB/PqqE/SkfB family radical SAM enzyme